METVGTALAGAVFGSFVPWCLTTALRLLRGDADRQERAVGAEVERLTGEIERQAARIGDLEDLIDLLRRALDKHLMRESAIASAAEFIIAIVKSVAKPTAEMMHLRDRAEQLLTDARAHIRNINEERRG